MPAATHRSPALTPWEEVAIDRMVALREAARLRPDAASSRRYAHRLGAGLVGGVVVTAVIMIIVMLESLIVAQRQHSTTSLLPARAGTAVSIVANR